ncbi:MAG: dihydropteroate synthase [Flavobacteriales bacterium]
MYNIPYPSINCQGKLLEFNTPKLMGILNVTPDSFYDGGQYLNETSILTRVEQMLCEGVDIIDVGAASSRPGAKILNAKQEIERLKPFIGSIIKTFPDSILSVDTYHAEVAEFAFNEGTSIINDISGGEMDKTMFETIAKLQVPYMLMHMKGTPKTMQENTNYDHLLDEIIYFFSKKTTQLHALGVNDIIIDPGFGFAKTVEQNFELLKKLQAFTVFDLPILIGVSRKSMLYKFLDTDAKNALNATSIAHLHALQNGANILRVHDVKEAKECIKLYEKLKL